jgi:hypothetical protein
MMLPLSAAQGSWVADGTPIGTARGIKDTPVSAPDGEGGIIVTWRGERSGYFDIYAQRVDQYGQALWTFDGVPVCTAAEMQFIPAIASDGAGGAIIAWTDARSGTDTDIYAQRVDASGTPLWPTNGVAICTASNNQREARILPDGAGGAIIAWDDERSVRSNIYAQRVDATGTALWTTQGVIICNALEDQHVSAIASDEAGGAIITWTDTRNGGDDDDIYAQRVNAAGVTLWTSQGVAVCTYSLDQLYPVIVSDGSGGAIIAWLDRRIPDEGIYAQKLDAAGSLLWDTYGLEVCIETDDSGPPAIATDRQGGAIVAWDDSRTSSRLIYAQRIAASGTRLWAYGGVLVCGTEEWQDMPALVDVEPGGVVLAWRDGRSGDDHIYSQRLDAMGNPVWATDGVAACAGFGTRDELTLNADGLGGVALAWKDSRSSDPCIYVQHLDGEFGAWGNPEPVIASIADVPEDQGGFVTLDWRASGRDVQYDPLITGYSIWRATSRVIPMPMSAPSGAPLLAIGPEFRGPAYRLETAGAGQYFWEWVSYQTAQSFAGYCFTAQTTHDSTGIDPGKHYFQVLAHTDDPSVFWASDPDSGYSVDNLAPGAPLRLRGLREDPVVLLGWEPSMHHDEDLSRYHVYRDLISGFEPSPESFIGAALDTTFVDDDPLHDLTSFYLVTAVDVHENEGEPSNELLMPPAAGIPETPGAFGFTARIRNPFAPSTRIAYQTPGGTHPSRTHIRIYDQAGRLVRTLVSRVHTAGTHEVVWDGTDDRGMAVASGVFLLRMELGGRAATETIVLVR